MLFDPKLLLSIIFLLAAFGRELVEARGHGRGLRLSKKTASAQGVDIHGLKLLKPYVCPADSNSEKRQGISNSTPAPVTVSESDLDQIYQSLKSIEAQVAGLTQKRSNEVSLEISRLDTLMKYVCPSDSNKIKRQTSSGITITISMEDLVELYQLVSALVAQIEALIGAQGFSTSTIGNTTVSTITDAALSTTTSFTSVVFVTVTMTTSVAGNSIPLVASEPTSTGYSTATTLITKISEGSSSTSSRFLNTSSSVAYVSSAATLNSAVGAGQGSAPILPLTTISVANSSSNSSINSDTSDDGDILDQLGGIGIKGTPLSRKSRPTSNRAGKTTSSSSLCDKHTDVTVLETITIVGTTTVTIMATQTSSTAKNAQLADAIGTTIVSSATPTATLSTSVSISTSLDVVDALSTADYPTIAGSNVDASSTADYPTIAESSAVASSTTESPVNTSTDMSFVGSSSVVMSDSDSSVSTTAVSSGTSLGGKFAEVSAEAAAAFAASPSSGYGYIFDSQSSSNVVVYFGQTAATSAEPLITMCEDPDIDIIVLSFVIARNYSCIYPEINFGAACGGQTTLMESKAPGLLECTQLASYISTCQSLYGKKVMLSIGGATAQLSFSSATDASEFATVLWQLFGPPGLVDDDLRPFGNVIIDGFDVDNEDNLPAHFDTFGATLRAAYDTDSSKDYYLSSAPQCPYPDASNPLGLLLVCDFVYVQFYNNPSCEIGSTGFDASLEQWSNALENSTLGVKPRLYLGAPAFSAAGSTAYSHIGSPAGIESIVRETLELDLDNFGGVMFWDGPEGLENIEDGVSIIEYSKLGLTT